MAINDNIKGCWVTTEGDSDVEFVIEIIQEQPRVEARCRSDGEVLTVSNLRWEDESLKFDTMVPSSGYKARHTLRFTSTGVCEHELTLWETWKRVCL